LSCSTRSAAQRLTPGPHIIPWPPAAATVVPATGPSAVTTGPRIGRWSGVKSMVAAQTLRIPSSAVSGMSDAIRERMVS
jgi:hypothetical protein